MDIPRDLRYTDSHEWVRVNGRTARVGITEFAQQELGDIIFLELPESRRKVTVGDSFGAVEAVKTVADLFAPVSGTVLGANPALTDAPERVNHDPYGEGWLVEIDLDDPAEFDKLLDADAYAKIIA